MDRALVDDVVTDELRRAADAAGTAKAPQALVDVAAIRERLLASAGSRTRESLAAFPTRSSSTSSSERPPRLWQSQGQLALIDAEGVVLDRVPVNKMPDLPLLIGAGANAQEEQLEADGGRADAEAAARLGNVGRGPALGSQFPVRRNRFLARGRRSGADRALQVRPHGQAERPARPRHLALRPSHSGQDDRSPAARPSSRPSRRFRRAS